MVYYVYKTKKMKMLMIVHFTPLIMTEIDRHYISMHTFKIGCTVVSLTSLLAKTQSVYYSLRRALFIIFFLLYIYTPFTNTELRYMIEITQPVSEKGLSVPKLGTENRYPHFCIQTKQEIIPLFHMTHILVSPMKRETTYCANFKSLSC